MNVADELATVVAEDLADTAEMVASFCRQLDARSTYRRDRVVSWCARRICTHSHDFRGCPDCRAAVEAAWDERNPK